MFTRNWFDQNIPFWTHFLSNYKDKPVKYLEIGCFEGKSTLWMMKNILTNKESHATVIDTFQGSPEHEGMNLSKLYETFVDNLKEYLHRITIVKDKSIHALKRLEDKFDIIYIDGSHKSADVLVDAILSFDLLKKGGMMIFDDYGWIFFKDRLDNPTAGIDAFLDIYSNQYMLVFKAHQVMIEKI